MADPILVVLEGPDGAGKSRHVRALREELTRVGANAAWWSHPPPPSRLTPWQAALHYASSRAAMLSDLAHKHRLAPLDLVICDRWWLSTQMLALVLGDVALMRVAEAESHVLGSPTLTVVLTASDAVLDARLADRGTPTTERDRDLRRVYESHARVSGSPIVDTSGPPETVTTALADHVHGLLKTTEAPCATS